MPLLESLVAVPLPPGFNAGGFDCQELDLTEYLKDGDAHTDQLAYFSRTYVVYSDEAVVAYFTVLADCIHLDPKERPKNPAAAAAYPTAPAIKLGRMGVHHAYKKQGVGYWMMDYVVGLARSLSSSVGIRYVTLDALDDNLVAFYSRYGFVRNEGQDNWLIAWLKAKSRWKDGDKVRRPSMRYDILLRREVESPVT